MEFSQSISNLAEAFAKFQAEVSDPKLDADTDYETKSGKKIKFKYSSLHEILRTVRPVLSKHGISLLQEPKTEGNEVSITTVLLHTSGEWIKFDALKMRAQSAFAQEIGSAITYGRRYNISSVLGLGVEDDDDGNAAQDGIVGKETPPEPKKSVPKKAEQDVVKQQYVKSENNEVLVWYPTFDDATKYKTPQKWLPVSGFNEAQCKYVLNRNEYEPAWYYVKAILAELQKA